MADDFPYMNSVTNLSGILEKIRSAGTPPKFTHEFLKSTLGFTSSNDRGVIKLLKKLGFLNSDSVPTSRYNAYRGDDGARAVAEGLREGWADIFLADERAHERSATELTAIFKNVSGKSESVAKKMATSFKALADAADWTGGTPPETAQDEQLPEKADGAARTPGVSLHQDVHIHLPSTSDVSVYTAIFRALRDELLD